MAGFSDAREAAILNSEFNQTLYLRLFTGTAGLCVNDNGTLPSGLTELNTGGYAPLQVPAAAWASAIAGAPSIKTVPNPAHSPLSFTPSGATWAICAYAWTTDTAAISSSNYIAGSVLVDVNSVPIVYTVGDGQPFEFTDQYPITERLGDPPVGVNPT